MILVVDDDKTIRLSLKLILERNGYDVALAEEPKQAVKIVRSTPAVDLVLMDMNFWSSESLIVLSSSTTSIILLKI